MIAIGCLLVAGLFRFKNRSPHRDPYKDRHISFYTGIGHASWARILKEFLALKIRKTVTTYFEAGILLTKPRTDFYDLKYYDGTNKYIVRFPKTRGPSKYSHVIDENEEDVTDIISMYAGPCHNFHGIAVTPKFLGYESLTFFYINDTSVTFRSEDPIVI
jgi:hypothetical protein